MNGIHALRIASLATALLLLGAVAPAHAAATESQDYPPYTLYFDASDAVWGAVVTASDELYGDYVALSACWSESDGGPCIDGTEVGPACGYLVLHGVSGDWLRVDVHPVHLQDDGNFCGATIGTVYVDFF